jgi:hypothetical protein
MVVTGTHAELDTSAVDSERDLRRRRCSRNQSAESGRYEEKLPHLDLLSFQPASHANAAGAFPFRKIFAAWVRVLSAEIFEDLFASKVGTKTRSSESFHARTMGICTT